MSGAYFSGDGSGDEGQHSPPNAQMQLPPETAQSPTASRSVGSPAVDEEEEKAAESQPTVKGIFLHFFFSRHPVALALKLMIVSFVLIPVGIGFFVEFPFATVGGVPVYQLLLYFGMSFFGISIVSIIFNAILRGMLGYVHESGRVGRLSLVLSQLQTHCAVIFTLLLFLLLLNVKSVVTTRLMTHVQARYRATQMIVCVIVGTVVMAWKRHYMKRVAMQFNYSNYSDRIQESLQAERIVTCLSSAKNDTKASRVTSRVKNIWSLSPSRNTHMTVHGGEIRATTRRMSGTDGTSDSVVVIERTTSASAQRSLEEGDQPMPEPENISPEPSSRYYPAPQSPMPPKTQKVISEPEKQRQFVSFTTLASKTLALFDASSGDYKAETAREAKKIASRLFRWLKPANRDYLVPDDLKAYLTQEDFEVALVMFRGRRIANDAVMITESDLKRGIDHMLQDRCGLAKSMQSIETALDKINLILTIVLAGILLIVFILVFTDGTSVLNGLTSLITAFSFIFGSTVTHLFESVIFLLVIHPFDVGDRVFIPLSTTGPLPPVGEGNLDNLVVVEMHVLSTIFERWDGIRVYAQNHILATKAIFNVRRSGPTRDYFKIQIAFDTPLEKINVLRKRLEAFVSREASDFGEYSMINVEYLENCNKLGLQIIILHRHNWQDMEGQLTRRSKALLFLRSTLEELGIGYALPVQRVQILPTNANCSLFNGVSSAPSTTPTIVSEVATPAAPPMPTSDAPSPNASASTTTEYGIKRRKSG